MIVNHDIDGHQLVQTAGAKLKLARLAMNNKTAFSFAKAGTYRLTTKTFAMEGMPEMETMGPDNVLRLTIVVTSAADRACSTDDREGPRWGSNG